MSEDEKKTIEYFKNVIEECEYEYKNLGYACDLYDGDEPIPVDKYKTLLNLIEKQQKNLENSVPKEVLREEFKEIFDIIKSEQFKVIMGDTTKCSRIKYILKEILGDDKK